MIHIHSRSIIAKSIGLGTILVFIAYVLSNTFNIGVAGALLLPGVYLSAVVAGHSLAFVILVPAINILVYAICFFAVIYLATILHHE